MTSQSPRIYTYKITFEEVPYYYYGVHKEKIFGEYYMGSPVTHKWCWEFYTPKKQILEFFDYTNNGYIEAQEVEGRLIKPVFNTDKWCLNKNAGGKISIEISKRIAQNNIKNKIGIFSLTKEQIIENAKKGAEACRKNKTGIFALSIEKRIEIGKKNYEHSVGIHALNSQQKSQAGKKGGKKTYELGVGIHGLTKKELSEFGKKSKQLGLGIHALTTKQRRENGKKNGNKCKKLKIGICGLTTENRRENVKITNSQKWQCCKTGYVSTAAGVVAYQRARGIDTSKNNRIRIS